MERLTDACRNADGSGISKKSLIDRAGKGYPSSYTSKIVTKLADYEDLEEQGLLLRLPCKVGDTIYYIEDNVIYEFIVYSFDIRPLQEFVCNNEGIRLNLKNFGKTVFLTQAEAKKKLKEMEGSHE